MKRGIGLGNRGGRRGAPLGILLALVVVASLAFAPADASAAACPKVAGDVTAWVGGGNFGDDASWSNGTPSGSCDTVITPLGSPTITMTGGASMKSLTLGGPGSTPTLVISVQSANTNLNTGAGGLSIAPGAGITLTCPPPTPPDPSGCSGGAGGGAGLGGVGTTITNQGSITVTTDAGTGNAVDGNLINTGTIVLNKKARFSNGTLTNKGAITIANDVTAVSSASHCGDPTGAIVKNDTGGSITGTGTGTFDIVNYEQGNGTTSGTNPVQIPCGTLKYSGNGASKVMAYGGLGLTGEMQAGQSLTVNAQSNNTNVTLGGDFTNNGSITLSCFPAVPPAVSGCNGGDAGTGAGFNVSNKDFINAGTFTVAAASGTGAGLGANFEGTVTNTGTIQFDQSAGFGGPVVNQGAINIANGKTVKSSGSSCGDAGGQVKNDTGGSINATGTGTFEISTNYEQGNGTTSGTNPVQIPCGTLKYSGNGASKVMAYGGLGLTGEMQAGQSLTVNAQSNNTNVTLGGDFTNNGSITLSCFPAVPPAVSGCNGGDAGTGAGFNVSNKDFINAGTFTVAAASGTGAGLGANFEGTVTNTGTIQFDQSAGFGGPVVNQGAINIANGKTVKSSGSSCGDAGGQVKNDTGGSINATGTGTFEISTNYEQGNGTTSGTTPVNIPCGGLKYTGNGASTVQAGGTNMIGNISSGQTLRIVTNVNSAAFANAGMIVFDQTGSNPSLNLGGAAMTNTGAIATSGASVNSSSVNGSIDQTGGSALVSIPDGTKLSVNALLLKAGKLSGGGTLQGSVDNSGGTVTPGASPGTLTVTGNYTQGAGGSLEIEVAGTGAGEYDKLTIGGGAALNGTLALRPVGSYASSAVPGDSIAFLSYGSTRAGQFAQVTTNPSLVCPKQFTLDYDDGGRLVGTDVIDGLLSCGNGGGGGNPPVVPPPTSGSPPASAVKKPVKCKKGFRKVKVKGKSKCKKVKRKRKKGRGNN